MATLIRSLRAGTAALGASLILAACGAGTASLRDNTGHLAPCDSGPHCVSSESDAPDRHIDPIAYSGSREEAQRRLVRILESMRDAKVVEQRPDYLYVTFTTSIMKFVDDVEFVFPAQRGTIEVRSSSRIGYYDFHVNRNRVEKIRLAMQGASS